MEVVQDPLTYALLGLVGFALAVLYAIVHGWLVPRRTVDLYGDLWERRLAESLNRELAWKEAHDSAVSARDQLADQVGQLLVLGETSVRLLQAMPNGPTTNRERA